MSIEIFIGASIILIAVLLLALRTNAGVVFFSVCAGSVLANQLGSEVSLIGSSFVKDGDLSKSIAYILLIVLPALLSAIFLRGSISSAKSFFNLFPSVAVGALLVLLVVPNLPADVSGNILENQAWGELQDYQPIILVGGVISSILMLYVTQRHGGKKHRRK